MQLFEVTLILLSLAAVLTFAALAGIPIAAAIGFGAIVAPMSNTWLDG